MPHKDNFVHLVKQIKSLKEYLKDLFIDENIELNAYLQILLKKDKKESEIKRLLRFYSVTKIEIAKADVVKIKKQIYKEIDKRVKEESVRLAKIKKVAQKKK